MKRVIFIILIQVLILSAFAQDFSGRYTSSTQAGQVILSLARNESGIYTGTISDNTNTLKISGQVVNGSLQGRIVEEGSNVVFAAAMQNQMLSLSMAQADIYGNINPATAQVMTFVRSGGSGEDPALNKGEIKINNIVLTKEQTREIVARYGIMPKPGNYWYDKVSGLYGVVGFPSYGFMYPGHNFGELSRNASSGNTGVLVNGRELPQMEWIIWSYILGTQVLPGSYWLDATGNVGYQGYNVPVVNLFAAAQKNSYAGKGGSGDNFWSSRFGAGNSNQDNTQGYVSVPGYGPVGYGF
jgi:hypothetical protein